MRQMIYIVWKKKKLSMTMKKIEPKIPRVNGKKGKNKYLNLKLLWKKIIFLLIKTNNRLYK